MIKHFETKVYGIHEKRIHPFIIFILSMICILSILLSFNFEIIIPCFTCMMIIAFFNRLKVKTAFIIFLSLIPFGLSMLAMQYLYPSNEVTLNAAYEVQELFPFLSLRLAQSVALMLRVLLLSYTSIIAMHSIDISYLLNYLMEKIYISPLFGFPIFIALHSIQLFKEEYQRIMITAKIRSINGITFFHTLLPLIVFALRFSQRAAISLELRGLNKNRKSFFTYILKQNDILLVNVSTIIFLVFIFLKIF